MSESEIKTTDFQRKMQESFKTVQRKFSSANSVPVERAMITRDELNYAMLYTFYKHPTFTVDNVDDEFEEWVNDPLTHWTCDKDAAYQAWQEQQETIDRLKGLIHEQQDQHIKMVRERNDFALEKLAADLDQRGNT